MQSLTLKVVGLHTHPNPFSNVPSGSLVKAKNMVVDKDGVVESRRGLKKYGTELTLTGSEKINALFSYKDSLLVHYGTKIAKDSDGAGTWSDYSGSYTAPTNAVAIRGLEANKNFYFTTNAGVKKLDSLSGTIGSAGMPKGLDGTASLSGSSGFLATDDAVAYRVVWGIEDANGNLVLGAPSQRFQIANSAGAGRDVSIVITIPGGITTDHFYQVYRSVGSGAAAIEPNDELGLVYENNPSSAEITAKSITFVDSVVDSLRGATLYTSPSQQGISKANDSPPLCQDMAFYKDSVFYANTISKQRLTLTIISIGGSTGLANDDTLTIGGVVFTGKATEAASSGEFDVVTGGTPAENISGTALSLCRVINQYASNTQFYAYYLSGYADLPGKILIEERSIGGAEITVISSKGSAFNPILPSSGTDIQTSNETSKNRLYIAKAQQPEAVPILNYIPVGSAEKNIIRVLPLRDSVFIFKEDGLFRLTGETFLNYQVSLFDQTVGLPAAESAVAFSNQIYAYTTQGVVAISDSGVQIISRPIEIDILPVATYSAFESVTFGVAYNSDRKYFLFMPKISTDTTAQQALVYNALSDAWTQWEMVRSCGIVNPVDDKLYLGSADSGYVYQERKDYATSDYADDELAVTITGRSGTTVSLSSTTGISEGQTLVQGGRISTVESIDSSTDITVADELVWKNGAATIYDPISVEMETIQQFAGNPGILKQYRDVVVFFRRAKFKTLSLGVKSNISAYLERTTVAPTSGVGWGSVPWGQLGWGGQNQDYQTVRTYIPRNKQRCNWLSVNLRHAQAKEYFAVAGMSMMYQNMSERTR